jgi:membrane-bound ClpP family serine protease
MSDWTGLPGGPAIARRYDGRRAMVLLGILLLGAGAGLLIAEAHLPSYGALGLAGVVALAGGAALAVDGAGGGTALILAVVVIVALAALALLTLIARATLMAGRSRAKTGVEGLVGHVGVIRTAPAPLGQVFVDGALWRARPCMEDELAVGDPVVVERVNGLVLSVRRAEEWEVEP